MIKQHKTLDIIPDKTVIWRYMSLAKFLCLIYQQKIHLHRMDLFEDKAEGTLSPIDKVLFHYSEETKAYWEKEPQRNFINCWTISPCELSLMWHAYAPNGVAIKTTAAALQKALSIDTEHTCYLLEVKYIDTENGGTSQDGGTPLNVMKIACTKRDHYQQEQEARLLYPDDESFSADRPAGHDFPIDTNALIEKVVISPYAEHCTEEVVRKSMEMIGLKKEISKSTFYQ